MKKCVRGLAWLLAAAVFVSSSGLSAAAAEVPSVSANESGKAEAAVQTETAENGTNTVSENESEKADGQTEPGEAGEEAETPTASDNEPTEPEETDKETETPSASDNEPDEPETELPAVSENEAGTVQTTVSDGSLPEEADKDGIRYILGREMTEEEIAAQQALEPDYLPEMEVHRLPDAESNMHMLYANASEQTLEATYDARDTGNISPVRNQNPWGTCWSFATMASMETSLISQGLATNGNIDLAEHHLAYFTRHTGYDVLDNANDDTIVTTPESFYLQGGNTFYAALRMMNWQGTGAEGAFPYPNTGIVHLAPNRTTAQNAAAHMRDAYLVQLKPNDSASIQIMKSLVKQYGCVEWSYYDNNIYRNYDTGGYYYNGNQTINHSIAIVGWDDTYQKTNFNASLQPQNDGAWIVRNSWGPAWGKDGYFYISYEDTSLGSGNPATVFIADAADKYDNNYFYGNTATLPYYMNVAAAAQVFHIKGKNANKEELKAVSFMLYSANTEYSIQLYKNPEVSLNGYVTNPKSGTPMLAQELTGTAQYAGVKTIDLPPLPPLAVDDIVSVVITFPNKDAYVIADGTNSMTADGGVTWHNTNVTAYGQSFLGSASNYWTDLHEGTTKRSLRINLLTDDVEETSVIPVLSVQAEEPQDFTGNMKYILNWNKCSDVKVYEIYRAESENGTYEKITTTQPDTRTYTDLIAKENWAKTYYYKVRAVFTDATVQDSQPATDTARPEVTPVLTSLSYIEDSVTVIWGEITGADRYVLERKPKDSPDTDFTQIANITDYAVTSYMDDVSGLPLGVYVYRIKAYSGAEASAWSEAKEAAKDFKVEAVSYNTVRAEWIPIEGAADYVVRVGSYSLKTSGTSVKIALSSIPNFKVGDAYTYYMQAYKSTNTALYTSSRMRLHTVPNPLQGTASYENDAVTFTWTGGEGADEIYIYRSTDAAVRGDLIAQVTGQTTYTDSNLSGSGIYYYQLYPTAVNSKQEIIEGEGFNYELTRKIAPAPIRNVSAQSETSLLISWESSTEAESYTIYRAEAPDGGYTELADGVTDTVYVDEQLVTGKSYYYKVQAVKQDLTSLLTETEAVKGQTRPEQPELIAEENAGVTIMGKADFDYAISDSPEVTPQLTFVSGKGENLTFSDLEANRLYYIFVRTRQALTGEAPVYGELLYIGSLADVSLKLTPDNAVLSKGNMTAFTLSTEPGNMHFTEPLRWEAYRTQERTEAYQTQEGVGYTAVLGGDGKEILRITRGNFYAVGQSSDKKVYLRAVKGTLQAECEVLINVPVTGLRIAVQEINGAAADSLSGIKAGDTAMLGVNYVPANADDTVCYWTTSDRSVAAVTARDAQTVELQAKRAGTCVLRAYMADGVFTEQEITVQKAEAAYGMWLSDKNLAGIRVSKAETGFTAEGVESKPQYALYTNGKDTTTPSSVKVATYVLTEKQADKDAGGVVIGGTLSMAAEGTYTYKTADAVVATVAADGTITAQSVGETDIYVYDTRGNSVYGSCHITVDKLPATELTLNKTSAFLKPGASMTLKVAVISDTAADKTLLWESSAPEIVQVSSSGKITAAKTTDVKDNKTVTITCRLKAEPAVTAVCQVEVGAAPTYPLDKRYKLKAAASTIWLENYSLNADSTAMLQIKDQFGKSDYVKTSPEMFEFTSAKPSVCIVDKEGRVVPNPEYTGKKTTVKVTARLKNDPLNRKVSFKVTILDAVQAGRIVITPTDAQSTSVNGKAFIGHKFHPGDKLSFRAAAYDSTGRQIEKPALTWKVSDTSIASLKTDKSGIVTLTWKNPGRVQLVCSAGDAWKKSAVIQLAALSSAPVISTKQVSLNTRLAAQNGRKLSESFAMMPQNGATATIPQIISVQSGKNTSGALQDKFSVVQHEDGMYSIAVDTAFAATVRPNTVYKVTLQTQVNGIPEIGISDAGTEQFTLNVKTSAAEPKLSVTAAAINRTYIQKNNLKSLLTIKAPDIVTNVRVLEGAEQINGFDTYFTARKQNGQWYLQFADAQGTCTKKSLSGKVEFTVNGYEKTVKNVTVKLPVKAEQIKQQAVPYVQTKISDSAYIPLYNATLKEPFTKFVIKEVDSDTLDVTKEADGTLKAVIRKGASYKDGARLTAVLQVMAVSATNEAIELWKNPVRVQVRLQAGQNKAPVISVKPKVLTLNKQTAGESASAVLTVNSQNAKLTDSSQWAVYAYNSATRQYDLQGAETAWLKLGYDRDSGSITAGFAGSSNTVSEGTHKFRIRNMIDGFAETYQDITVKVVNATPKVTVRTSGRLDLVNRSAVSVTGQMKLTNIPSAVSGVIVQTDDRTAVNPYYTAAMTETGTFRLELTQEGYEAELTAGNTELPLKVVLENGQEVETTMRFQITQSVPKLSVPAPQTIYKSTNYLTKDYDMTRGLAKGVKIRSIGIQSIPNGMSAITKEGHVLVTLYDTGMKPGTYKITTAVYFEGQERSFAYPNGKPVIKTISVKVAESS